jgi:hypothetical protein
MSVLYDCYGLGTREEFLGRLRDEIYDGHLPRAFLVSHFRETLERLGTGTTPDY